jgi:hypothetical protein
MCIISAFAGMTAAEAAGTMAVTSALSTAMTMAAQAQQASATGKMIGSQEQLQKNQIAQQADQQANTNMMNARSAQAQSIVAAGAAGINTDSNSFMASIQSSVMNEQTDNQLIGINEANEEENSVVTAQSEMNTNASSPSIFAGALNTALSGAGAYMAGSIASGAANAPSSGSLPANPNTIGNVLQSYSGNGLNSSNGNA